MKKSETHFLSSHKDKGAVWKQTNAQNAHNERSYDKLMHNDSLTKNFQLIFIMVSGVQGN